MTIRIYEKSKTLTPNVNSADISIHDGKKYQLYRKDQQNTSQALCALKAFGKSFLVIASFGLGLINREFRENYFSDCVAVFTGKRRVNRYFLSKGQSSSAEEIAKKAQGALKISAQTKPLAPEAASPRGNFANAGATSFLSIALHYIDSIFLTLPAFPKISDLKKEEHETEINFNKRKNIASEVLELFEKINRGENCSAQEISKVKKALYDFDPSIGQPDPRVPGDSFMAAETLSSLFSPVLITGKWLKMGSAIIRVPNYMPEQPTLGRGELIKEACGRKYQAKLLSDDAREAKIQVTNLSEFPTCLSFQILGLHPTYKEQFPFVIELLDERNSLPKVRFELSGITTTGNPHNFYGKEKGQWICYRTDNDSIDILSQEETAQLLKLQNAYMVQYRKL